MRSRFAPACRASAGDVTPLGWQRYHLLFVFGTLIYLRDRELTWCVPANRCASLLAGLVASGVLVWLAGEPAPGHAQLAALVFVVAAIGALSRPVRVTPGRPDPSETCATRTTRRIPMVGPLTSAPLARPGSGSEEGT